MVQKEEEEKKRRTNNGILIEFLTLNKHKIRIKIIVKMWLRKLTKPERYVCVWVCARWLVQTKPKNNILTEFSFKNEKKRKEENKNRSFLGR